MNYQVIQEKIVEDFPHDKTLHFIVGFFIFLLMSKFVNDNYAFIITLIIAFLKEIRDQIVYKGFDWKDILATILPGIMLILAANI